MIISFCNEKTASMSIIGQHPSEWSPPYQKPCLWLLVMLKAHLPTAANCTLPVFNTSIIQGECVDLGRTLANGTSCTVSCSSGVAFWNRKDPGAYQCSNAVLTEPLGNCTQCTQCTDGQYVATPCSSGNESDQGQPLRARIQWHRICLLLHYARPSC
jgi:hypothetical protein